MTAWARGALGALGALASIALALWLSVRVAAWAAGRDVSDVGVAMYARGPLGLVAGLATYAVVAVSPVALLARRLETQVPWYVALSIGTVGFVLLAWALRFTYG